MKSTAGMEQAGLIHFLVPLAIVGAVLLIIRWLVPVRLFIAASTAGIDLPFQRAAAIDLAGRDVRDSVSSFRYPENSPGVARQPRSSFRGHHRVPPRSTFDE